MAQQNPFLSKSKYMHGRQCPKLLWYEYNRKAEVPQAGAMMQNVFDEGRKVGSLAHELFPGGIIVERDRSPQTTSDRSLLALKERKPLFEAGFVYKNAYALADVLVPVEDDQWDLVEVKSSTSVKDDHLSDAAFQKYTYSGAGVKIRNCYIMYINKEYVKQGEIEPEKLFIRQDVTAEANERIKDIETEIESLQKVIAQKEVPDIKVGPQCGYPDGCPLIPVCWDFLPDEEHIFILYAGGQHRYDLMERGVLKVTDIPADYELDPRQTIQFKSHKSGKTHIDKRKITGFLKTLKYPYYFLDFETIGTPIPIFDGTSPYQAVPFQYSLFIVETEGAEPKHYGYLAPGDVDPRIEILKQLKELLGTDGSIIAYSAPFEIGCLRRSADYFTEYQEWFTLLENRFADLLLPFQKFFYYSPDQAGRASLKSVLPAITHSSYDGLEIAQGGLASSEYARVTFGQNIDPAEKARVRHALELYCDQDTRGMIEILAVLKSSVSK